MPATVTFTPTLQSFERQTAQAQAQMESNLRLAARTLSQRWVAIAREEAPRKTGKFRDGIEAKLIDDANSIGFIGGSPAPLGTFINKGTKPHKIYPRKANALYFFWGKIGKYTVVPKGGGFKTHEAGGVLWIGKGFVQHPGTKPNPYVDRTFSRWIIEAEKEIGKVVDKFILKVVQT